MGQFHLHNREEDKVVDSLKEIYHKLDSLSISEQQLFYQMLRELSETGDSQIRSLLEKTVWKNGVRPPSPEEFLDYRNGWLPKSFSQDIFPERRDDFLQMFDEKNHYNYVVDYGATGTGKSFALRLIVMYSTVWFHHLQNPALYYEMAESTGYCMYFVSYKMDKARQLLLEPIFKLFRMSPRFEHVNLSQKVFDEQPKHGTDKLIWSKAAYNKDGFITLGSGLKYYLGNDNPDEIRGADLWQYYATEISYFVQQDGISEDQVYKLIMDAKNRLFRTMANKYLSWLYIDTSARSASSIIEKYLLNDMKYNPKCFFRDRRRWDIAKLRKTQFPIYNSDPSQVFEIITGDGQTPAKIITHESEKEGVRPELIKPIPIDGLKTFQDDLITAIRDVAGYPTSDESKYIQNIQIINRVFDNPTLTNIEGIITADAGENPEDLIWNQVKDVFFARSFDGKYSIKRAPRETRFLGLDLAKSNKGDLAGIAILHPEWSNELRTVLAVYDFVFPIGPGEVGINLQAIEDFVVDLMLKGNLMIMKGFLDTALSAQSQQNLNRRVPRDEGFIFNNSVDRDMNDYQGVLSGLHSGIIKAGRNIFLKNNLMCLERRATKTGKEIIDHPIGDITYTYDGNWETSFAGNNMKDVSDALVQAYAAWKSTSVLPSTIYEEENARLTKSVAQTENSVKKAFTLMNRF